MSLLATPVLATTVLAQPPAVPRVLASNFLIPDATFIAELVAFAVILAVLWRYVVPPLQKSMTQRQEAIRQQFADADAARARLEAAEADYRTAIDEARAEAARAREDAAKTRREIIDAAKEEARTEAEAVTRRAEEQLEVQRRQVIAQLRGEIGRLAVDLSERLVGESLGDADRQARVVDRFLAELDGDGATGGVPAADVTSGAATSGAATAGAATTPAGRA